MQNPFVSGEREAFLCLKQNVVNLDPFQISFKLPFIAQIALNCHISRLETKSFRAQEKLV